VSSGFVTVGSHTHSHISLSSAPERETEDEIRRSKELMEDRLGAPCRHFAYPFAVGSAGADRAARRLFDTAAVDAWRTTGGGAPTLTGWAGPPSFALTAGCSSA
jgi:peptidoglycan/xylan/chitin deacetylase (PgdA/CDA1 family)